MNRTIKIVFLALTILLVVAAFAPTIAQDEEPETYAMVVFLRGSEFFNWAYAGMIDAAERIGAHIEVQLLGPAEWDASLEAREIEQLTVRGVDGIVATAGDAETMNSAIDDAIAAGIPVILFDSDAPGSDRLAFVGTNNYNAGCRAGEAIAEWHGDAARVGISTFPGPDHLGRRVEGFEDCLMAAAPGAEIVQIVNDEGRVDGAEVAITAMLQANPTINVIFAAHGTPGPGAAAAIRNLGLVGEIDIMAFDFGLPVLELIESGEIRATVGQNPYLMGYMSMMLAYAARNETEVTAGTGFGPYPPLIDTGVQILGPDDIAPFMNPPTFE
ncbi:MAG: sugar ABC transporter substrate-binding protein [Chloroflexi bacterium]|nr:sugar ABC transporter substrate-binding protein [Chloroflexota bacterium]